MPTHPLCSAGITNTTTIGGISSSMFEGRECTVSEGALTITGNYFPRSIISRHKIINPDFNAMQVGANGAVLPNSCTNVYFAGLVS
jgi:hypothetical protein